MHLKRFYMYSLRTAKKIQREYILFFAFNFDFSIFLGAKVYFL